MRFLAAGLMGSMVFFGASGGHAAPASAAVCAPVPACATQALEPGPRREASHTRSRLVMGLGSPRHRARDLFQRVGEPQTLTAKFTHGMVHKDLEDEEIDVWVLRHCSGSWERLGTTRTGSENRGGATGSTERSPEGRATFAVPQGRELAAGLHRVRFVVAADGSSVDALAEILPKDARFFVSDIDGTLTTAENAEVRNVLEGITGSVNVDAPRALSMLAAKGYRPLYLSARPEWLTERTHAFLAFHGFPMGAVRVTPSNGATGDKAAAFKGDVLATLASQGLVPSFGFGNQPSDTTAYESAKIPVAGRFFLRVSDAHGGRRFESYTELLPGLGRVPCL